MNRYFSPIEVQMDNLMLAAESTVREGVVRAVWNMGFKVNEKELTQALTQDTKRYEYAYDQGWNDCKEHYEQKLKEIRKTLGEMAREDEE